jgi:hypothetical protein
MNQKLGAFFMHTLWSQQGHWTFLNADSAPVMQSVKTEGGILAAEGETFGEEWQHAAGAQKKKEAKGRSLVGAAIPSVHLRLDGDFHSSMLATWTLNSDEFGADMLVWS